ncbi:MAG: ABC-F type ribosomal protection protein [Clostridia bacterium]|nr:ABC-F type ribosomal protection protein [Clostridia bacterium]
MQYKILNGAVSYDGNMVLENVDIEINDREKIAVIGRNGCGKTTLLKAIMGEVELEEGTGENALAVIKSGRPEIAYLRQTPFENENEKMIDEVRKVFGGLILMEEKLQRFVDEMGRNSDEKLVAEYSNLNDRFIAQGGLTYKKEYQTMIRKFKFTEEDEQKPVSEFSGGQRTKISFIKMLLSKPDILLLDEPTNHLDIETIEWLEEYLKSYKSALVIVSHDRMFLNKIVDKVYEIEWGETRCYKGDYSAFERQKRERHIKQQKDHDLQRAEIERLTKLIERFRYKATKASMVQSKIKLLEKMQIVDAPDRYDTRTFRANTLPKVESSRQVLNVSNLVIGYNEPLAKVSFNLEKGQKLGIIGGNGVGKSTLVKTIMGKVKPIDGAYQWGYNTDVAYFDQQLAQITGDMTIFDSFSNQYPFMSDTEVRRALGSFQFTGEDVFKSLSTLSGGEKVRLTLCKILHSRPNVLILDEPTNHLDIVGKETLENMLIDYQGTIVFVSHDRYFVSKIADRLLVFDEGNVNFYQGTYAEYEETRKPKEIEVEDKSKNKTGGKKYTNPSKERSKMEKRLEKLEGLIEDTENTLAMLNEKINSDEICSDYVKVLEVQNEIEAVMLKQEEYMTEWADLSERLAELNND